MTTPTGPVVASASVAITPSTSTFNPQLQASLQRAMNAVSDAADRMGDDIARGITSGVARARLALSTLTDGLNERVRATVTVVGQAEQGLFSIGQTATKAGAAIGTMGLAAGNLAFTLGSLLSVASELSGIMVALPAVIGSAALVMGTLKIATEGFGEAVSAALTGDLEEIFATFSELTPAARSAAVSVFELRKRIDALKDSVQENFFQPVAAQFGQFARQATEVAESGLPRISTELGKIAGEFLKVANSGSFFPGLRTLIDETVSGLQRWEGVTGAAANALGDLFSVGAQFSGDLIAGVGVLIQRTSEWISTAAGTGELQLRLQAALDTFSQLGRIIGNVRDIFGAFFSSAQEAGANFLGVLENLTERLAIFLNSDAGSESLTALMTAGSTAATILGDTVGALLPVVGQLVLTLSEGLTDALLSMQPGLELLTEGLGFFAQEALGGVSTAIGSLATSFGSIMTAAAPLLPVLGEIVGLLAEHFAVTLGIVADLINSFLTALQPFLPQIQAIITQGLDTFATALLSLAEAIAPLLPTLVELAVKGLQVVADLFSVILDAVEPFLPVLVELATKVLTLVVDHFANVAEVIEPLIPVIIELVSNGFEFLAQVLPVVLDALKPLLPVIIDVAKQVGTALAPVLPTLVTAFKDIFKALIPVLPQLAELAGNILVTAAQLFTALVQAIAPLLPPLVEMGISILQTLVPAFLKLLEAIIPILPTLSDLAVRVLKEGLLPVLNALLPILPTLTDALIKLLPSFVDLIPPMVEIALAIAPIIVALANLANLILQIVLPPIVLFMTVLNEMRAITLTLLAAQIDAVALAFKIAWDAIVAAVQIAWAILKGIFDIMISLLQGDFSEAWRRLQRLVGEVWEIIKNFVSDALGKIRDYIVEWGPKLYNAAFDALKAVANVFSEKFGEFVTTAQNKITEVAKKFEDIPAAVNNIFMSAGSWLYDTGKDIIQGFINGIVDKAQALYDTLQGVVNKAKELWEGATGWITGSPSRWMETRGKWVVQGFANGLESEQGVAVDATQALLNATKQPFQNAMTVPVPNIAGMMSTAVPAGTSQTANTAGMSIVFGNGAVAVSFEGVVPSEADALRTGYAVGNGILDAMARRDARLAIRVM